MVNKKEREAAEARIRKKYEAVRPTLTERGRRLWVASEARALGYGGIAIASRATGMAPSAIGRGLKELARTESSENESLPSLRSRRAGAGRKKAEERDPTILTALNTLIEATTRGDPESPLLWTARSLRNIVLALKDLGYTISTTTVARLLKKLGYSLQANQKKLEGAQHPDRNAQFEHINEIARRQLDSGNPVISVDAKKRELVGNFKNPGRELCLKQSPEQVNGHDFKDEELGHVRPYGVYDLKENEAWVSVGINHETGEFAVETIRTWWKEMGQARYPDAKTLVITADAGGSNGYRLRLWKYELQKLSNELGFPIMVCHFPPGTSKWNKIEHRLFSFITQNWRGKPLVSHQVIVNLIGSTTTRAGLRVQSRIDKGFYAKGRRITDKEMAEVNLHPERFHGDWNYAIHPTEEEAP